MKPPSNREYSAFFDSPVAAEMDEQELSNRLNELNENQDHPREIRSMGLDLPWKKKLWQSNAHAFGFISTAENKPGPQKAIVEVGEVKSDKSLVGGRVNMTLNLLRVADYPGTGTHRILFDFYVRNQTVSISEEVHFTSTYRVLDSERSGIKGFPIFVGLAVGSEGLALRCFTINIRNDDDEKFLAFLDSDSFKSGIKLAQTVQPAIAPLSSLVIGVTKAIASRSRNIPVQDVYIGLDFDETPGGARLALGTYVIVQIPEEDKIIFDWRDWCFRKDLGQVVSRTDNGQMIPYNYFMIGIAKYNGE